MKYFLGALVVVLLMAGAFFGYRAGSNHKKTNPSSSPSASESTPSAGANILDLSNKGLTKVTADIYNKTATTDLILSNNSIKTLPSEMGRMTNLKVFKINNNVLEGSLIAEVRQMAKLQILDVSNNNMTGMPAEIGQLSNLQTLNYCNNKITGLPNELSKLRNSLKEFNLSGNPLSSEQISKLKTELPNTTIIF